MPLHIRDHNTGEIISLATDVINGRETLSISSAANTDKTIYDALGRNRVVNPVMTFASNSAYDTEPNIWQTITNNGSATWNSTTRSVDLLLNNTTGYVVRQTYRYLPYQPGRSQFVTMTGVMGTVSSGVTKRIGQFDAKNGIFFEYSAQYGFCVVERNNGVDTRVTQSEFNLDKLNGTGSSGVTLDLTKDQLFVFDYAWLGIAPIRYGFYIDGSLIYCHITTHANKLDRSYMQTATLPLRYEVSSTQNAVTTLKQICTAVSSEGGYYDVPGYTFSGGRNINQTLSVTTENTIIAIRPALTFGGLPNRVLIKPISVDIYADANPLRWRLLYYPPGSSDPTTGGTWVSANSLSATEIKTDATGLTIGSGIEITSGYVTAAGGVSNRNSTDSMVSLMYPLTINASGTNNPLDNNTGASPAYLVLSALGASANAAGRLEWSEIR